MKYIKAFITGITVPSILLPILICSALALGKSQVLTVPFLHFIPLIWGIWNVLYFAFFQKIFPKNLNARLLLTGALLGLLIAVYGIFWLHIPALLSLPQSFHYLPLVLAPIFYAILWRFLVKPLNNLLGLQEI